MMVALIGALAEFRNLPLTDYELAELAHSIERDELGIRGGRQDQYAAAFGGFSFIELEKDRVVVNPLRVAPDVMLELEHNLLLCYTGTTRQGDHIIEDQTRRFEEGNEDTLAGLRAQKELAVEMKNALLQRRLRDFGELLDTAWEAKKRMSDAHIEPAHRRALRRGAQDRCDRRQGHGRGRRRLRASLPRARQEASRGRADAGPGRDGGRVRLRGRGTANLASR